MGKVTLEIPEEYVHSFGQTVEEAAKNAMIELAVAMYRSGRWSTRRAGEFANMNRWQFMDLLMARKVEAPYTSEMLEQDLRYALGRV